jgi:uncharacterized protein with PIN domain
VIAYFDTSALVKLVVSEADSELARQCFESASLVLTHQIAYVEAHSAISRNVCLRHNDSCPIRTRGLGRGGECVNASLIGTLSAPRD